MPAPTVGLGVVGGCGDGHGFSERRALDGHEVVDGVSAQILGFPGPPVADEWQQRFVDLISRFAQERGACLRFCRDLLEVEAIAYPVLAGVHDEFIKDLKTPLGVAPKYDGVFDHAVAQVKKYWEMLAVAIVKGDPNEFGLENGDLDTGLPTDHYLCWR